MTKRPRNDDYISITKRKRHLTLWFDDGNIILTTNASLFRVHRCLLSMNSPVFADMLSMPQPEHVEDGYEGFPLVEISDNDTDFTHLLCFFYDHRYYQGGSETTFEKISGLLRMSTKYQMDDLRDEVISHLAMAYPSTVKKYLEVVNGETPLPLFPPFRGQHFAVVALARETDASILLPAALWRSMCMPTRDILKGAVDLNGTRYTLSPTDIELCMLRKATVYKNLVRAENTLSNILKKSECIRQRERGDPSIWPCIEIAKSKVVHHFSSHGPPIRDDYDLMIDMRAFEAWRPLVCDSCRVLADLKVSVWHEDRWNSLPALFDLPR
ncbi:hypothetical protein BD410DRAFT_776883 [Rickenella mellea]|uniref:BTB domain-containing protein n=1 Tax=Rickenella mellea TaxID=50990 RepID=A0A4Y7PNV8_9AGAM|nr:hypothetical protein BD410DRAFT_776883 [Rickenella mellea]